MKIRNINSFWLAIKFSLLFLGLLISQSVNAQEVAILKYEGGGDWYANPTAIPNLIRYCNENIDTGLLEKPKNIEPQSKELYNFPIVFLTGHGNVFFSDEASENLRNYLISLYKNNKTKYINLSL